MGPVGAVGSFGSVGVSGSEGPWAPWGATGRSGSGVGVDRVLAEVAVRVMNCLSCGHPWPSLGSAYPTAPLPN